LADHELIRMENISKRFGDIQANENINITISKGEVHAILGENGAGKSTLMNILSGIYSPDSGSLYIQKNHTVLTSPQDSINAGICMIYQHFKLVDVMTVWENISAGPNRSFYLNSKKLKKKIESICSESGLSVNLDKKISELAVSEKQTVEIIKALYRGAEILILDEPTAVLTPQETEKLFQIISKMRAAGKTVIIITHKLYEVMAISDRVTVLRKGRNINTISTKDTTQKELAEMMVGKTVRMQIPRVKAVQTGDVLKVKDLNLEDSKGLKSLENVSFSLQGGEILGVAGIAGSGQNHLCEAIVGLRKLKSGSIVFKGEDISGLSAREIKNIDSVKLNFVPEDRLGMGLVGSMNIVDNVMLKDYKQTGFGILDRKSSEKKAEDLVKALDVSHPGFRFPVRILSGGNIQKILIGRELSDNPEVLIAAYPVRGLDIGVTNKVIDLLNEQKVKGAGILFLGEDLDLLLEICDRIMVLAGGKVVGIVNAENSTKEDIGMMMCGYEDGWCEDD
jgi:general nucleoside transport system ATP-binding protein